MAIFVCCRLKAWLTERKLDWNCLYLCPRSGLACVWVFLSLSVCLCLHICVCMPACLWRPNCNTFPHCAATNWHRAHPHSSMAQLALSAAENHKYSSLPLLFFSLVLLSPPRSSEVQLTVPACPSSSSLLPLTSLLTLPSFYFLL